MSKGYKRQLQPIIAEFLESKRDDKSFTKEDVALWALRKSKVVREEGYAEKLVVQKLAEEIADVMREIYVQDDQGRTVRDMYAARIGGKTRWNTRRNSSRGFMEASFMQRRDGVVGDLRHLKTELDSFNENRSPENPIQMSFDFRADLAELEEAEAIKRLAGGKK